jgi:hypothetical protein
MEIEAVAIVEETYRDDVRVEHGSGALLVLSRRAA